MKNAKIFVRLVASSLFLFGFVAFVVAVIVTIPEGEFAYPVGLQQYVFFMTALAVLTQWIGAIGLLFLRNWARLAVIVGSLMMAAFIFAHAVTQQYAGIPLTPKSALISVAFSSPGILIPIGYVMVLLRQSVKQVMR